MGIPPLPEAWVSNGRCRQSKTSPTRPPPGTTPFEQPDAFVAYMVNTVLTRTEAS